MIQSVVVKSFRGLSDVRLDRLSQFNIIGGQNNVGKTSLLEALYLLLSTSKPEAIAKINTARAILGSSLTYEIAEEYMWRPMFARGRTDSPVELSAQDSTGSRYRVTLTVDTKTTVVGDDPDKFHPGLLITYRMPGMNSDSALHLTFQSGQLAAISDAFALLQSGKSCRLLSSGTRPSTEDIAERFGNVVVKGRTNRVVEALRIFEPDLISLQTLRRAGLTTIWAELKPGYFVPAHFLGEGSIRLGLILLSILDAEDGIVLVDEFENGIHHSMMDQAWTAVGAACKAANVQLVVTTHSMECIASAERSLASFDDGFSYLRMDRLDEKIVMKPYTAEVLDAAIETNLEVR